MKKMTEEEDAVATDIMHSMGQAFRRGADAVDPEFALRCMGICLAGLVFNYGRKRREFLNFMTNAWDDHAQARKKVDKDS
jgi:hypothetical protein